MNQQKKPEIAIIGAGAVGSLLGGLMSRAGNSVTLIGRNGQAKSIGKDGLKIDGVSGCFTVRCTADIKLSFKPDIVMLGVKMQDLEQTCRTIAPLVNNIPVLTLQNGVSSDSIAGEILGKRNIVGGIVLFNAKYTETGHVTHGSQGPLLIGNPEGADETHLHNVRELLDGIVPVVVSDNIGGARWAKLFLNLITNSFDAMTGVPLGICMKSRGITRAAAHILKEALAVTRKAEITFGTLPVIPMKVFKAAVASPLPVTSRIVQRITKDVFTMSSTLQSLQRRKPTEIDYLNGEIVRYGNQLQIPTPCNAKVVEIIREIEKTGTFYSIAQIEEIFRDCAHPA